MYKFYSKNGTVYFYEHGVEIDGTVYGIHTDRDILRIKRRIVNDKFAETTVISIWVQKLQKFSIQRNVGTAYGRTAVTDTGENI